jgi:hypothetical protein
MSPRQTAGFAPRQSCRNHVGLVFRPAGFFTFLFFGAATRRSRNRVLTRDLRCLHSLHRHGTCPVNGHRPRGWTSDLFSSQPRPELWGSSVESCLHPWRRSNKSSILSQSVQCLYINYLLSVNKLVLSYLLLRLHPQHHTCILSCDRKRKMTYLLTVGAVLSERAYY